MQTYKKRFRKKRTIKKQQKQRNRILKGVVCYKIKIIPRSYGGGSFDEPKYKRLGDMIKDVLSESESESELEYFHDIDKNIAKKQKLFNEIFKEEISVDSDSIRDTKEQREYNTKLKQEAEGARNLLKYLNNGNKNNTPTDEDKETLKNILIRKAKAANILKQILEQLDQPEIKKQLTPKQIASIKKQIENTGGITNDLSSIGSSVFKGVVSLGSWLVPEYDSDVDKIINNKQRVKFLWYPRKHVSYKKGNSGTKHNEDDPTEYGDFMILIEPEKYANTGEYFKQTYHSVEDLLATLLMGCTDPFCLQGEVMREPYNWRYYDIVNRQPMFDKKKDSSSLETS